MLRALNNMGGGLMQVSFMALLKGFFEFFKGVDQGLGSGVEAFIAESFEAAWYLELVVFKVTQYPFINEYTP